MTDISIETVEQCRERNGAVLEDRDSSIGETLVGDTVGYNEGDPLVGDSYNDYPNREDLANPSQGEFLETLFSHELVGSYTDAVKELTGARTDDMMGDWESDLEASAELHGLDAEGLFANACSEPDTKEVVSEVLGYRVEGGMLQSNSVLLLSALYTEGLSVQEISNVLETEETSIRDSLKEVGLLRGKTTSEQTASFRENGGRLSHTNSSVNYDAVERNDSVSIVSR